MLIAPASTGSDEVSARNTMAADAVVREAVASVLKVSLKEAGRLIKTVVYSDDINMGTNLTEEQLPTQAIIAHIKKVYGLQAKIEAETEGPHGSVFLKKHIFSASHFRADFELAGLETPHWAFVQDPRSFLLKNLTLLEKRSVQSQYERALGHLELTAHLPGFYKVISTRAIELRRKLMAAGTHKRSYLKTHRVPSYADVIRKFYGADRPREAYKRTLGQRLASFFGFEAPSAIEGWCEAVASSGLAILGETTEVMPLAASDSKKRDCIVVAIASRCPELTQARMTQALQAHPLGSIVSTGLMVDLMASGVLDRLLRIPKMVELARAREQHTLAISALFINGLTAIGTRSYGRLMRDLYNSWAIDGVGIQSLLKLSFAVREGRVPAWVSSLMHPDPFLGIKAAALLTSSEFPVELRVVKFPEELLMSAANAMAVISDAVPSADALLMSQWTRGSPGSEDHLEELSMWASGPLSRIGLLPSFTRTDCVALYRRMGADATRLGLWDCRHSLMLEGKGTEVVICIDAEWGLFGNIWETFNEGAKLVLCSSGPMTCWRRYLSHADVWISRPRLKSRARKHCFTLTEEQLADQIQIEPRRNHCIVVGDQNYGAQVELVVNSVCGHDVDVSYAFDVRDVGDTCDRIWVLRSPQHRVMPSLNKHFIDQDCVHALEGRMWSDDVVITLCSEVRPANHVMMNASRDMTVRLAKLDDLLGAPTLHQRPSQSERDFFADRPATDEIEAHLWVCTHGTHVWVQEGESTHYKWVGATTSAATPQTNER